MYDHMRTNTNWLVSPVQDGHDGIPKERRIKHFGTGDGPFPLDLFLKSIDSMEDSLLPGSLSSDRGDYTTIDLSRLSGKAYREEWRKNLESTLQLIRQSEASGTKDDGEPPNLEDLGVTVNFIPHSRDGILSLFPPHKPHPLPPSVLTHYSIVPTQRVIRQGTGKNQKVKLQHGTGAEMVHETPHIHFMITPTGFFTFFHHDLPFRFMNYNHLGAKFWLTYPATKYNMEQWYTTIDTNWFRTPQWAFQTLKGLKVCITGPGERYVFQPGYFHACFTLTSVVQSAQEYVSHDELSHVLRLQHDGLKYMREIPKGHKYSRLDDTIASWTTEIESRFFTPFRSLWKNEWDFAVQRMKDNIKAEEDKDENDVSEFVIDDEEF